MIARGGLGGRRRAHGGLLPARWAGARGRAEPRGPTADGRVDPRGRGRDPVRRAHLRVARRQPRPEGDAAHALRAVGGPAAALDRADARSVADRQDRGRWRCGPTLRRGSSRRWRHGSAGGCSAGGFARGAGRGRPHGHADALRRPARARRALVPGPVLDRLLRRVALRSAPAYVTPDELGVYSACVRVALAMVLFLTAVSYVFSPFVADLHARGERARLDRLFKSITRWTVAGHDPDPAADADRAGGDPAACSAARTSRAARRRSGSS